MAKPEIRGEIKTIFTSDSIHKSKYHKKTYQRQASITKQSKIKTKTSTNYENLNEQQQQQKHEPYSQCHCQIKVMRQSDHHISRSRK